MAIIKSRKFCKTCNSYKVFNELDSKLVCETCNLEFQNVEISEIPNVEILEQRERYKSTYLTNFMDNIKNSEAILNKPEILMEDDAGLLLNPEFVTEMKTILATELYAYREAQKKIRNIGRNCKCYCGSGKKYKKCCIYKNSKY